jgi:D-alanine transaminase
MELAMIQGKIMPLDQVDPSWLDRGTYFGDGVYEVIRSYDGKLFALDDHLSRLKRSLEAIDIMSVNIDQVRRRVKTAYKTANIANAKVYLHVTRGTEIRDHTGGDDLKPNFFLTVTNLPDHSDQKTNGIAVCTYPDIRWKRCDIKSLNLLPNVLAKREAARQDCEEAIFIDDNGDITEGAGSAFFMVLAQEKKLVTRPLGPQILDSITRKVVIEIAPKVGLTVLEKALTPWQADWADELFLAVTTKDIVPVTHFDGEVIADGKSGKYTKLLIEEFQKEVRNRNTTAH